MQRIFNKIASIARETIRQNSNVNSPNMKDILQKYKGLEVLAGK